MTLRIVANVREDGTTIRLVGRMRAEHIEPVRAELAVSRAPTALDLDEVTLTDIDAVVFSWLPNAMASSCSTVRRSFANGSRESPGEVKRANNWRRVWDRLKGHNDADD